MRKCLNTSIAHRTFDPRPCWAIDMIIFQGKEKVLVTGPWYSQTEPYQILFGGCPVPTTLVQTGVLRCFCPG